MHSELEQLRRMSLKDPTNTSKLLDLGNALADAGQAVEAVEVFGRILQSDPDSGYAWNNLGNIFTSLNDLEAALSCFSNAVRLLPHEATAQYSIGRALSMAGREREALGHLLKACTLNPEHVDTWITTGNVRQHLGQWQAALHCFDQALMLASDLAEAHISRSIVLLNQGNFRSGWAEYEYRWETPAFRKYKEQPFASKQWGGETLTGKSILLHAEQGFGDAIQFARFIPEVKRRGADVFLEVRAPLAALFVQLVEADHIVVAGDLRPDTDFNCGLLSLPGILEAELSTIPNRPYLVVPKAEREKALDALQSTVADKTLLRVGLAWRGNPAHRWDFKRSLTLAQLAPLAQVKGVQWYALHPDATVEELTSWSPECRIIAMPQEYRSGFEQTAAVTQALDLVISVDTAHAHLAGALGKPVWLLLSLFYEWRWHSHLETSPWYPSARLFRQEAPGEWAGAIEHIAESLAALKKGQSALVKVQAT